MALSKLEQALIERLQEPRLDSGLNAAANIVHEITRIQAPDNETPADYIRRAVQELKSDPTLGLELAVEAYKHYSGFQFNAQSGKPTDYLIEMAKRHKQLFEAPADSEHPLTEAVRLISSVSGIKYNPLDSQKTYLTNFAKRYKRLCEAHATVDLRPGMEHAAILVSNRAGMPIFPSESNDAYLVRVADQLKYALTMAERVHEPKQAPFTELFELIFGLSGIKPTIELEDFKENAYKYMTQIAELLNKNKKPE